MEQKSLVNLKATEIMRTLGAHKVFQISHYGKPLCTVVPIINSVEDLYNVVTTITQGKWLLIPKPVDRRELTKLCRELEKEVP